MNSIENVLHNEAYAGVMVWPKRSNRSTSEAYRPAPQRVEGAWPAVVDKTIFDQAEAMLAARAPAVLHPRQVDSTYVLSGLMRCGI